MCAQAGYIWSPKDPSPLEQRAAECGGCEYLRVRSCPLVMGMLTPAVTIRCSDDTEFQLPLDVCLSGATLKAECSRFLERSVDLFLLHQGDGQDIHDEYEATAGERLDLI